MGFALSFLSFSLSARRRVISDSLLSLWWWWCRWPTKTLILPVKCVYATAKRAPGSLHFSRLVDLNCPSNFPPSLQTALAALFCLQTTEFPRYLSATIMASFSLFAAIAVLLQNSKILKSLDFHQKRLKYFAFLLQHYVLSYEV